MHNAGDLTIRVGAKVIIGRTRLNDTIVTAGPDSPVTTKRRHRLKFWTNFAHRLMA